MEATTTTAREWTYEHQIGVIHVESWGDPYLVVTEDAYFAGEHCRYTYYDLGETFTDVEKAKIEAARINLENNLPRMFNSNESQNFLLEMQDIFTSAEIKK